MKKVSTKNSYIMQAKKNNPNQANKTARNQDAVAKNATKNFDSFQTNQFQMKSPYTSSVNTNFQNSAVNRNTRTFNPNFATSSFANLQRPLNPTFRTAQFQPGYSPRPFQTRTFEMPRRLEVPRFQYAPGTMRSMPPRAGFTSTMAMPRPNFSNTMTVVRPISPAPSNLYQSNLYQVVDELDNTLKILKEEEESVKELRRQEILNRVRRLAQIKDIDKIVYQQRQKRIQEQLKLTKEFQSKELEIYNQRKLEIKQQEEHLKDMLTSEIEESKRNIEKYQLARETFIAKTEQHNKELEARDRDLEPQLDAETMMKESILDPSVLEPSYAPSATVKVESPSPVVAPSHVEPVVSVAAPVQEVVAPKVVNEPVVSPTVAMEPTPTVVAEVPKTQVVEVEPQVDKVEEQKIELINNQSTDDLFVENPPAVVDSTQSKEYVQKVSSDGTINANTDEIKDETSLVDPDWVTVEKEAITKKGFNRTWLWAIGIGVLAVAAVIVLILVLTEAINI